PTIGTANFAILVSAGVTRLQGFSRIGGSNGIDLNDTATLTDGFVGRGAGNGFAFYSEAGQRMILVGGVLLLGTTVATNAPAGDIVTLNTGSFSAVNAAGNNTVGMIGLNSSNDVILLGRNNGSGRIKVGNL